MPSDDAPQPPYNPLQNTQSIPAISIPQTTSSMIPLGARGGPSAPNMPAMPNVKQDAIRRMMIGGS